MTRILAADIGGTNSRFAAFEAAPDGTLARLDGWSQPTGGFASFRELLKAVRGSDFGRAHWGAQRAALAVAGPVRGRTCLPPNIAWDIDLDRDLAGLGLCPAALLNDFTAQAWGCLAAAGSDLETVQAGEGEPGAPLAVVGAGTGLGHCALAPDGRGGWLALPSEAGHAVFAFAGQEEAEYARFLRANAGLCAPVGDQVVSGSGLALLHWFLASERLTPGEVAARMGQDSPTVRWFARFYGRACRHYVLNLMALGGLFVCGGVAAQNPVLVRHKAFLREFTDCAGFEGLLGRIPVALNADREAGLLGAARAVLGR